MRKYAIFTSAVILFAGAFAVRAARPASRLPAKQAAAKPRTVPPLELEEQIPMPNVAGRIDHFTADPKRKRLILSALGNNTVEVIDVFAGRTSWTVKGLAQPQGPLYVPSVDQLYVANAQDGTVRIFDGASYTFRKSINFGKDPDNLRYDQATDTVFVGFGEEDGGIAKINPKTGERTGSVYKTGGHPESFQLDASGQHIFVNVPDAGNIVESIDRHTAAVTKWPLNGLRGNYDMALDNMGHRLFVITRKPPMMAVLDTTTGKEVSRLPAAGESDDVYFDASRKRIYVIGAAGFLTVIQQDDPDRYHEIASIPTGVGVRTGYFFASRDRLYLGVPATGNEPAQVWTYEAQD